MVRTTCERYTSGLDCVMRDKGEHWRTINVLPNTSRSRSTRIIDTNPHPRPPHPHGAHHPPLNLHGIQTAQNLGTYSSSFDLILLSIILILLLL